MAGCEADRQADKEELRKGVPEERKKKKNKMPRVDFCQPANDLPDCPKKSIRTSKREMPRIRPRLRTRKWKKIHHCIPVMIHVQNVIILTIVAK